MNNIMYLCEGEHSGPERIVLFRAEIWREIIWKIGLKNLIFNFNLELSELLNWTLNLIRTWTKSQILLQINTFLTTCTDASEGAG